MLPALKRRSSWRATASPVSTSATGRTLAGSKFLLLLEQISAATGARFLLQPCNGLADQIEFGELESDATDALLRRFIEPLLDQGADVLVLGCTHYPLVQASIERVIAAHTERPVTLVDTGDAVARQLERLLSAGGIARPPTASHPARLDGYTSASATALSAAFAGLLGLDPPMHEVPAGDASMTMIRQNN